MLPWDDFKAWVVQLQNYFSEELEMAHQDIAGSVLFVCVENAGRSQMAQAFAEKYGLLAESAGTVPASRVNPLVAQVMREKGLDISANIPKMLTPEMISRASMVVTMGCSVEEVCPRPMLAQMQKKLVDWNPDDPGKID